MSGFEFNEDMALKLVFQRADDPEPIGVLDFSGPEMTFSGRADESAKAFFDAVIKNQVGRNKHLEDVRRQLERELAAAIKQRDNARRWLRDACAEIARIENRFYDALTPQQIAERNGWDCFAKKEGGGA